MPLTPYRNAVRSKPTAWSKRMSTGGSILVACSVIFAFHSTPHENVTRNLSAKNPADYFKDQPEAYYQALLSGAPRNLQSDRLIETAAPSIKVNNAPSVAASSEPTTTASGAPSAVASDVPSSMPSAMPSPTPPTNPNVYAFYIERPNNLIQNDESLKEAWLRSWQTAGYNATILTLNDAQLHAEYAPYTDAIENVLISSSVKRPLELVPCYLRYLAMAVQGGGMMVDLDMTPKSLASSANNTLPDQLTTYCDFNTLSHDWLMQVETQNGLPCAAVAASGEEWLRVGKLLGWVANQHLDQSVWSDAHALQFLTTRDEVQLVKQEVAQSWRTSGWDRCHFRYV